MSTTADPALAYERLVAGDPRAAERLHPNDAGVSCARWSSLAAGSSLRRDEDLLWAERTRRPTLIVGLDVPSAELERRIAARTDAMFERGVVDEVRRALEGPVSKTADKALGLHEIASLPAGEARDRIVVRTRQYAAYQRKWMRRIPGLVMVDANRPSAEVVDAVLEMARAR